MTDLRYLFYGLIFIFACSIYFLIRDGRSGLWLRLRKSFLLFLIAGLIGIGLSSIQLVSYIELYPFIKRNLSLQEAGFGSLPIPLLLGFFSVQDLYFPEWINYTGVSALLLVGIGKRLGWAHKERFWAIVIAISILLCLGDQTPLFEILYTTIPGFKLLRVPSRWTIYALFGISLLAAWGLEKWLAVRNDQIKRAWIVPIIFGLFYLPAAGLSWINPGLIPFELILPAVLLILTTVCLFVFRNKSQYIILWGLLILDLWLAGSSFIKPVTEEDLLKTDDLTSFLATNLQPDERFISIVEDIPASLLVEHSIKSSSGYDSVQITQYNDYINNAIGCDFSGYAVSSPSLLSNPEAKKQCVTPLFNIAMLKALNTHYVITPDRVEQDEFVKVLPMGESYLYDLEEGFGRFFSVEKVRTVTPDQCIKNLQGVDLEHEALIEQEFFGQTDMSDVEIIDKREEGRSEFITVVSDGPGLLIRSETWAPGWKAWVDSSPAPLIRIDCTLQGVWVNRGIHEIRFEYLPDGYLIGRWICLFTLIILIGVSGYLLIHTRVTVKDRR